MRFESQPFNGTLHGQQGSLQNIELVNFFNGGHGNRAAQRFGADFVVQLAALQSGELF